MIRDFSAFCKAVGETLDEGKMLIDKVVEVGKIIFDGANNLTLQSLINIGNAFKDAIVCWLGDILDNVDYAVIGLIVGTVVGGIIYTVVETALFSAAKGLKITKELANLFKILDKKNDLYNYFFNKLEALGEKIKGKCGLFINGCFVKDTPILMAGNTIGNSGKVYAMAAMMPFVGVPVDDTPLLGYALANKTVNSSYHMTASNNDDVYTGLMNGDPYTSAEQKHRDLYEINDTDWHSVTFEGIYSSSICHLALHQDWITNHGYVVDGIVNMNLPEQSISGPFKIISIKHITPQKKPVDEDEADDYEYRPVTGLFVHESNDVWKITFDDGTELGVTNNHPIFSVSKGAWQHAGHLEIGEEVLAKGSNTKVTSKERDLTVQPVYNLEVKDLHNFLVGEVGVVVHNNPNCLKASQDLLDNLGIKKVLKKPGKYDIDDGPNSTKIKEKFGKDPNKKIKICYDDTGFPDFSDFIPSYNGKKIEFSVTNLTGNHSNDMVKARSKLKNDFGFDFESNGAIVIPGYEGITWTFHHHQDGETMQLVPFDINNKADHVGGAKIIEKGGKGNYSGPDKISKTACN